MSVRADRTVLLFVWPFERLWYENEIHYHYTDFGTVYDFFRRDPRLCTRLIDGVACSTNRGDLVRSLAEDPDLVVVISHLHNIAEACEVARLAKAVSPCTATVVYGPASPYAYGHFLRNGFDACVTAGDWELGIAGVAESVRRGGDLRCAGVVTRDSERPEGEQQPAYLDCNEWGLPPLADLPLADLFAAQRRRELSITAVRGCSYRCHFCYSPRLGPARLASAERTAEFIASVQGQFESLQFYGSNFTHNRDWVNGLCAALQEHGVRLPWRCVTRYELVDAELLKTMAEAGCVGIGMGVESLAREDQETLGKHVDPKRLVEVSRLMHSVGIQPKAFIMLGIPGQKKESVYATIAFLREHQISPRPNTYVPYADLALAGDFSVSWGRHSFAGPAAAVTGLTTGEVLRILYDREREFARIHNAWRQGFDDG
jgi:radical SAM superfamily enzyme YgiQ (UPF0313 family)